MQKINDIYKGDVIAFKIGDESYRALLCTSTYKAKSPQYFTFAALTYDSPILPTLRDISNCHFFGIGNRKDEYFKYSDKELQNMWRFYPCIKPYCLGSYGVTIWKRDFIKFRDNIEFIGNLIIVDNLDKNGNGSMNASDWIFLKDFFNQKFKTVLVERGQKLFSIKSIICD